MTEEYLNQLRNSDQITKERLLFGNFEYDDDPTALIDYDAIIDLFTNTIEKSDEKYLTVDAARFGGDKITFTRWKGLHAYKITYKQKQGTDRTEEDIKQLLADEQIPRSHTIVDEDGVGGGIVDHLKGIKGFTANSTPVEVWDTHKQQKVPANFESLKAQCSYLLAEKVNKHEMAITCEDPQIREWIVEELEQVKSKDADKDGKRKLMPKDEVKERLGRSPDFADGLMMRMYFELKKPKPVAIPTTVQGGIKPFYPSLGI